MRSRSLKHLVTFQELTESKDSLGGPTNQWVDVPVKEWTQIIPLKGSEQYVSQTLNTVVTFKIRMRYRADINSKMKIVYGTRVFEIDSVLNPFERNRELQIMATEVFDG